MRIIAGVAGGRRLRVPPSGTRPTSDRVRESLFSALDARVDLEGARVIDCYAGSGALGLEALSRGAASAVFIERDREAFAVLQGNIAAVGLPGAECLAGDVLQVLRRGIAQTADVVLCDPPYDLPAVELASVLDALVSFGWVGEGAIAVVERAARDRESPWPPTWTAERVRTIGETALWYGHVHAAERERSSGDLGRKSAS